MNASRYIVCLWPGLPELWFRGRWSALPAAVMFAAALNFLIVARFVFPELLIPSLVKVACWVSVAVWGMLVVRASGRLPELLRPRAVSEEPDPFPDAHSFYLGGQWDQAEAKLTACLEVDSRDCQALLMLAGLYRHTERFAAALGVLEQLGRLETADGWWLEVAAEKKRLERVSVADGEADAAAETQPKAQS